MVPETQDPETLGGEEDGAVRVMGLLCRVAVAIPIQFDDEAAGEAGKVRDIGSDRHLPAKMRTVDGDPVQCAPQTALGRCLGGPQPSRAVQPKAPEMIRVGHSTPPRRPSAADPPPLGEGER